MPPPQSAPRFTLRLHIPRWQRECLRRHLVTDQARADALGVSRSQVIRLQNRTSAPGPDFIAAVLAAFGNVRFADMFDIVEISQ